MWAVFRISLVLFMLGSSLWASSLSPRWYIQEADKKIVINVELFLSSTCTHCHKADAFFQKIESSSPWLHVTRYTIDKDKSDLKRFNQLLEDQQMSDFAVPSIFFCNSRWVGFGTDETTGKDLLHALNYCKEQIEKKGKLTSANVNVLRRWANANLFDAGMTENPTAVKYITVIALMDAYNPCALFCLGGFFALLFMQDSRKRQILSGCLFILALGVVHFIQQVYTSTFFESLPWLRWPAALVGLFTFYMAGQYYRHRSTSNLFFLLALLLGLMLQIYQQTCLMNWSYIFQQWLYNQHLSNKNIVLYQLAYQIMYLVPLIFTLILYVILIKIKYLEKLKQRLNTIGLLYIMAVGLFLIIYPWALSNLLLSLFVILCVLIAGLFLSKFNSSSHTWKS
ncbi:membrane protein [Legionella antarctica]|uniref:Membrane protein n=1 Tax=Legionella antarctica TaxID=2708020 RepID=A0A6F8T428_9GAMM|nr:hypothetical protein [Legionella antarctica]BCA94910.1 membrane protein [Legionella antarctica]